MDARGPSESGAEISRPAEVSPEVSRRYIAHDSPLKKLRAADLVKRFQDIETDGVPETLQQLADLDDRDAGGPSSDPDVDVTGAFHEAPEPREDRVIRCEPIARVLFPPTKKPRAAHAGRTDWLDTKNHVARVACNDASLRVALRALSADGEGFCRVSKTAKTYTVDQSEDFQSSVQYRCLAKVYARHGYPSCNCIVTVFKTRDAMHYVLSKGQPHKHPPIAFLISSGRERGLPPKIQEILRLGYLGDAYDEVKAIQLLRDNQIRLDLKAATHDDTRRAMSRFVRSLKDDRADEFWASSYAQFARIITPYLAKSLPKLADLVNDPVKVDEVVVLDADIGGPGGKTFLVWSTPRMLLKAAANPNIAAVDGTGRLNFQGKLMIVLNTIDARQHCHPIAYMLLTKGEAADEVTQGLMVIREAIRAGFVGLQINSPLHTVRDLPRDWIWNPRITINDGADALFNSWENLKKALPAAAPARTEPPPRPPLPIPLPPRMPRHIDGLPP